MPSVLNTNAASLYASKNLQVAQSKLADSVERLSSGLRINRAKDDAAGLGISASLTRQINGANQGVRNLNDGISLLQTTEGSIAAAQEMAQRILTLATQGANGTMGTNERVSLKDEMKQLLTAIDSIGTRANFSGVALLNSDARTSATGKFNFQASSLSSDTVSLDAAAFKNLGGGYGVLANSFSDGATTSGGTAILSLSSGVYGSTNVGTEVYKRVISGTSTTYTRVGTVSSISTANSTVTVSSIATSIATGAVLVMSGQFTQTTSDNGTTADYGLLESVDRLDNTSASYQMVSRSASGYINLLSTQRNTLGAYENQLEFTTANVESLSSNLTAGRSNIQDTDYAEETATLTKGQILQQAATAMLAQANQMPNVILSLLK